MARRVTTMGDRIKQLRERRGLTQQDLAVACSVAISQVSRWERNENEPGASSLRALRRVLEVSYEELLGDV